MSGKENKYLKWISEIQAIAQSGLTYTTNPFDKERFLRLREVIAELAADYSENDAATIKALFSLESGYATPKLDVRAFVLHENTILLVKEKMDGLWTLPGGWTDVNESPAESASRETREEAGFEVRVLKLLALWDKLKHDHPPQWPHSYKCFFHCEIMGGEKHFDPLEILDVDFFKVDKLPPLSLNRVTEKQIIRLYNLVDKDLPTQFD